MKTITAEGNNKKTKVLRNVAPANVESIVEKLYDQGYTRVTVS